MCGLITAFAIFVILLLKHKILRVNKWIWESCRKISFKRRKKQKQMRHVVVIDLNVLEAVNRDCEQELNHTSESRGKFMF